MTKFFGASLLVLACSMVACSVHASASPRSSASTTSGPVQGGWERLGARTVEGRNDRDVIHVGRDDGRFSAIEIRVDGSALVMEDIKVVFGNGDVFEPKTRLVFHKDSRSRVIDLPGDRRVIRRVEFRYGNLPGGGRAQVELFGR
ncbi:MAG: hypothetical protein JST00_12600 [Deltaproteobacteria bacterium]|nr:hypothetical protein [Deltaproteobacteria bacterium]